MQKEQLLGNLNRGKKLRLRSALSAAALVVSLSVGAPANAVPCVLSGINELDGSLGSSDNPYAVGSKADLEIILPCSGSGVFFEITADIDLGGVADDPTTHWTPLGDSGDPFVGIIQGNDHVISGLVVDSTDNEQGLFGVVGDLSIEDLNIVGSVETTGENAGLLAGLATGALELIDVDAQGNVHSDDGYAGLLVGQWDGSFSAGDQAALITGSDVRGEVFAGWGAGGLVGYVYGSNNDAMEVNNSRIDVKSAVPDGWYAEALGGAIGANWLPELTITTTQVIVDFDITDTVQFYSAEQIGGLVGNDESNGLFLHSVSVAGQIVDQDLKGLAIGGLVGYVWTDELRVQDSSFVGVIEAGDSIGGAIGFINASILSPSVDEITIDGVEVFGELLAGEDLVGGIVGHLPTSTNGTTVLITNSANYASVTLEDPDGVPTWSTTAGIGFAGGIVGYAQSRSYQNFSNPTVATAPNLTISETANFGSVTANTQFAGGIAGGLAATSANLYLSDVANYGDVVGHTYAGSITAELAMAKSTGFTYDPVLEITRALGTSAIDVLSGDVARGTVAVEVITAGSPVATLNAAVPTVLWDGETSDVTLDELSGTASKTSSQLKAIATYQSAGYDIATGWDTNYTWGICESFNNGYPFLTSLFHVDVCADNYAQDIPDADSIRSNWDFEEVWAACDLVDGGRSFLRFAQSVAACSPATANPSVTTPYAGPLVISVTEKLAPGEELIVSGSKLDSVTQLKLGDYILKISSKTPEALRANLPADIAVGTYQLEIISGSGRLLVQQQIVVTENLARSITAWTVLKDGYAKVYVKDLVGAGKVQIFLNGAELAWVRADSADDPKLKSAGLRSYLVRSAYLDTGKNIIEVYLEGERIRRVAYTLRD